MPQSSNFSVSGGQADSENDEEPPSAEHMALREFLEKPDGQPPSPPFIFPSVPNVSHQIKTRAFRKKYFPNISTKQWNDWHWQISNSIIKPEQLCRFLNLSVEEETAIGQFVSGLPLRITPYYMSLLDRESSEHPLRRAVVPTLHEFFKSPSEADDPLGEESQSPLPGLVHRYPDRALLLVIGICATYCRYCTRSRIVGKDAIHPTRSHLEKAIEYIRNTPAVRDVLLSGGDPLMLNDGRLEWLLKRLREIPHVEVIRIGTKVPAVLPQRITPQLVRMLRKYHPLWMSLHFIHPHECTPETNRACKLLADAGIPLGSQTVLLKGVNDSVDTMKTLVQKLMKMRVRPYYLYQCDPVTGTSHFRTSVQKGLEIIKGLRGYTSGYAVPNFVIDAPGGGGKIPVMPDYVVERESHGLLLRNYEDKLFFYPDSVECKTEYLPTGVYHG